MMLNLQEETTNQAVREVGANLNYLTAAYTAVWIILAIYLLVLWSRNRRLNATIAVLEQRVSLLEGGPISSGTNPGAGGSGSNNP